jgi:hypothetical protein
VEKAVCSPSGLVDVYVAPLLWQGYSGLILGFGSQPAGMKRQIEANATPKRVLWSVRCRAIRIQDVQSLAVTLCRRDVNGGSVSPGEEPSFRPKYSDPIQNCAMCLRIR